MVAPPRHGVGRPLHRGGLGRESPAWSGEPPRSANGCCVLRGSQSGGGTVDRRPLGDGILL